MVNKDDKRIVVTKYGFMAWEADVTIGNVVYTFTAWTSNGAWNQANKFLEDYK